MGHQAPVGTTESEELNCLYSPLLTDGGLQEDNPACTAIKQQHQCDYTVNLSRAESAKPNSSYQHVGADWGLQTLRQACYQENPESAMCVQSFDDSRGLAIRITYRISLRSSSLWEPRHPLLKVVKNYFTGPTTTRAAGTHKIQILVSFLVKNWVWHHWGNHVGVSSTGPRYGTE